MNYLDPGVQSPLQVPGLPTLHGGLVYASAKDRQVIQQKVYVCQIQ